LCIVQDLLSHPKVRGKGRRGSEGKKRGGGSFVSLFQPPTEVSSSPFWGKKERGGKREGGGREVRADVENYTTSPPPPFCVWKERGSGKKKKKKQKEEEEKRI